MSNKHHRDHATIVSDASVSTIMAITGLPYHTVYYWERRNSIPTRYWQELINEGHATITELLKGADKS